MRQRREREKEEGRKGGHEGVKGERSHENMVIVREQYMRSYSII